MPDVVTKGSKQSATGVKLIGRTLYNQEDYNADLQGSKGTAVYDKMRLSDPEIASSLMRLTMPLTSAKWSVEPADIPGGEEHAELCEHYILGGAKHGHTHGDTWRQFLEHALLMLPFGFSMFEKVWGVDEKGRQVYAQIAPILPKTIDEFRFGDNGALSGALQRAYFPGDGFKTVELPVQKLVVISFSREGDNFWGRSILRPAYQPWFHKRELVILDGIRHERHGVGFMWIKLPEGATASQREDAESVAREARAHERQGIVTEGDVDVQIIYPTGTASPLIESLKYYDSQIAQTMIAEWMHLGASESGSRATAQTKIDYALMAYQGTAKVVEEAVNQQLVVELVNRNFGTQEAYPTIQIQDLDKMSGDQLALILAPLGEKGFIKPDRTLEEHLREVLDLPEIDDADRAEREAKALEIAGMAQAKPGDGEGVEPGTTDDKEQNAVKDAPGSTSPKTARLLAEKGDAPVPEFWREPFDHERYCAFSDQKRYLDSEPARILHRVVMPRRRAQIDSLAVAVAAASDADLAKGDFTPTNKTKMTEEMFRALFRVYVKGRSEVVKEAARQRAGIVPKTARMLQEEPEDLEGFDITPSQRSWVRRLAQEFVTTASLMLVAEAVRQGIAARQADFDRQQTESRVRSALEGLSVAKVEADISGKVTTAFINGRNEQAAGMGAETAFYSAIMDVGTCKPCEAKDGGEHEPGDSNYTTPNPECDWPPYCRCETVYIFKEEAA